MVETDFSKLSKFLELVRQPGRSVLYDLKNRQYKNNKLKQNVWREIAGEMNMESKEVQGLWKRTKIKFKAAQNKENAPSGSGRVQLKPIEEFLLKEMDFIRAFADDETIRTTNYNDTSNENIQQLFDEVTQDVTDISNTTDNNSPAPKKKKQNLQDILDKSFSKIDTLVETIHQRAAKPCYQNNDAFHTFLENQLSKFDVKTREELETNIIQMVLERKMNNNK